MSELKKVISSVWLRLLLLVMVAITSQQYPLSHLHHSHYEDNLSLKFRALHQERSASDSDEHRHTHVTRQHWLARRAHNARSAQFGVLDYLNAGSFCLVEGISSLLASYNEAAFSASSQSYRFLTRGPPCFG